MSDELPPGATMIAPEPPVIPAARKAERWKAPDHLLVWVHTGRAHVRLADGQRHCIETGTGIWIPPGADHEMWTEPGTVAFPTAIPANALAEAPRQTLRLTVEDDWHDWLIAHYAQSVGPTTSLVDTRAELVSVLGPYATGPGHRHRSGGDAPRLVPPRSPAAGRVARALTQNPSLDYTLEEWAGQLACTPRTLQRAFLRDTGMTFDQWRRQCRLLAASAHLATGYAIEHVAAATGFTTRQGFSHAFRTHYGLTPSDYAKQARTGDESLPRHERGSDHGPLTAHRTALPPPGRGVPETRIGPMRSSRAGVLRWTFRGEGWSRIADQRFHTGARDGLWIPAGHESETRLPEGSVELPIIVWCHDDTQPSEALHTSFPPSWDAFLLYASVRSSTALRPERFDCREILQPLRAQLAVQRARYVPMPRDAEARAAARSFLRRLGTGTEGSASEVSPEICEAFRHETGMTFSAWRYAARMRIARDLLAKGTKAGGVADRVGYSQLSNFSSAFSRFHGVPPSVYQQRELDGA